MPGPCGEERSENRLPAWRLTSRAVTAPETGRVLSQVCRALWRQTTRTECVQDRCQADHLLLRAFNRATCDARGPPKPRVSQSSARPYRDACGHSWLLDVMAQRISPIRRKVSRRPYFRPTRERVPVACSWPRAVTGALGHFNRPLTPRAVDNPRLLYPTATRALLDGKQCPPQVCAPHRPPLDCSDIPCPRVRMVLPVARRRQAVRLRLGPHVALFFEVDDSPATSCATATTLPRRPRQLQ